MFKILDCFCRASFEKLSLETFLQWIMKGDEHIYLSAVHVRAGPATIGAKIAAPWCPDVGLRVLHGPFSATRRNGE